jgi:Rrf2 family protein
MRLALTRRADYAVRAMLALAREPERIQSGKHLARATGIPVAFVSQVMSDLSQAGLVEARVGRAGGYRLMRPVAEISMLSVVEAVEGDTRRRKCVLRNTPCGAEPICSVHNLFAGAQEALIDRLAAASLSGANGNGPATAPEQSATFQPLVRHVQPADLPALVDFYDNLSAESRYERFLGFTRGVAEEMARSFCTPDHTHGEGFVALLRDPMRAGPPRIVGHLCLQPCGEGQLELAVAVADAYQGRGIGRQLFTNAINWAQAHAVERIYASAFVTNSRVLRLLSSAPYPPQVSPAESGVVDVTMPLVAQELPADTSTLPAEARGRAGRSRGNKPVSRSCRVVWRGTRPPARAAADSTSTGSN